MAIFLKHGYKDPPNRWGSFSDVKRAVRINAEKVYNIDASRIMLSLPLFWGMPILDYSDTSRHPVNTGSLYNLRNGHIFYNSSTNYIKLREVSFGATYSKWAIITSFMPFSIGGSSIYDGRTVFTNDLKYFNDDVLFGVSPEGSAVSATRYRIACTHQSLTSPQERTNVASSYEPTIYMDYNTVVISDATYLYLYINGKMEDSSVKAGGSLTFGNNNIHMGGNEAPDQESYRRRFDGILKNVIFLSTDISDEQAFLFDDLPYTLYQKVSRPLYFLPSTPPTGNSSWYFNMLKRRNA